MKVFIAFMKLFVAILIGLALIVGSIVVIDQGSDPVYLAAFFLTATTGVVWIPAAVVPAIVRLGREIDLAREEKYQ